MLFSSITYYVFFHIMEHSLNSNLGNKELLLNYVIAEGAEKVDSITITKNGTISIILSLCGGSGGTATYSVKLNNIEQTYKYYAEHPSNTELKSITYEFNVKNGDTIQICNKTTGVYGYRSAVVLL